MKKATSFSSCVIFFQSALKVYIKSNVDVHSFNTLCKSFSKCGKLVPNLTHFEKNCQSA